MSDDAFVSFLVGMLAGCSLGIMVAGFLAAVNQTEERREKEFRDYERNEEHEKSH